MSLHTYHFVRVNPCCLVTLLSNLCWWQHQCFGKFLSVNFLDILINSLWRINSYKELFQSKQFYRIIQEKLILGWITWTTQSIFREMSTAKRCCFKDLWWILVCLWTCQLWGFSNSSTTALLRDRREYDLVRKVQCFDVDKSVYEYMQSTLIFLMLWDHYML